MAYEASTRDKDKWAEKIHAYKANQARIEQLRTFTEELTFSDRELPTPRKYEKPQFSYLQLVKSIFEVFKPTQYLP